jgi:hypothetical protein
VDTSFDVVNIDSYSGYRKREVRKHGFSASFDIGYKISENINFVSGVKFYKRGYKYLDVAWHDTTGIWWLGEAVVNYNINSLGIPIGLEYNKSFKKLVLNVGLSLNTEYIIKSSIDADVDYFFEGDAENDVTSFERTDLPQKWGYNTSIEKENGKMTFSVQANIGLGIKATENLEFYVCPYFNYGLKSLFKYPVNEHLYIGGFSISGRVKF